MCGIAGLVSGNTFDGRLIATMTSSIRHRGPDDEGYTFFTDNGPLCLGGTDTPERVFASVSPYCPDRKLGEVDVPSAHLIFGHRRLSIIDLSPVGHQPMCYQNRYWITYNGEVYNYPELRLELEAQGCRFSSQTDTEVILAAYDVWGPNCPSHLNGMWAFAIYDTYAKTLFLSRDRFGVKPLYYWSSPCGLLAFGSEIKQFVELPGWEAKINEQMIYDFLVWSVSDHSDQTAFEGVYQLRPGQSVILNIEGWETQLSHGRLPVKSWYELSAEPCTLSFEDAAQEFRRRFTDSVRLRLRADVPVGSCLSGGLDSSSVVCVINDLLREQGTKVLQKTFSACADTPRFDERKWVEEVLLKTSTEAHFVYPSVDRLFQESSDIVWHQDEPFGSTSIYAQWNLFRLAAENGVKVMLDGQGADEQLAGYHVFFAPLLLSHLRKLRCSALISEIRALNRLHGYSHLYLGRIVSGLMLPEAIRKKLNPASMTPSWLDCKKLNFRPHNPMDELGARTRSVYKMSRAQLTASNLQMLLHWEDRDSMAHSIEARVPFLDYRLVEFVLGLPDGYKLANGITKRVLRRAMDGILPDAIRGRIDKLGFVTPESEWASVRSHEFSKKLAESIDLSNGLIKPDAMRIFEDITAGRSKYTNLIWRMISFGEWISRFNVRVR